MALLLAPLGICAGGAMAAPAPVHGGAMDHSAQSAGNHAHHGGPAKPHVCPECQPPSFVKAASAAAADVAPATMAIAPAAYVELLAPARAFNAWRRVAAAPPPPLRRPYRIRLQI
jgi:hypothetical protein